LFNQQVDDVGRHRHPASIPRESTTEILRAIPVEERVAALEAVYKHLATKADIARLEGRINTLEANLQGQISGLEGKIDGLEGTMLTAIAVATLILAAVQVGLRFWRPKSLDS